MSTRRWLPQPMLSLLLLVVWLLLMNDFGLGHWVLGALLGILIPLITHVFWPHPPTMRKPSLTTPPSRVQSQVLAQASAASTWTPWRRASCSSWAGA